MDRNGPAISRRESVIALAQGLRPIIHSTIEQEPFRHRGFSDRTIKALVDCSIDAPERLLSMPEHQLRAIPGIGKAAIAEIRMYREKYRASSQDSR